MNADLDLLNTEQRRAFEDLKARASALGCDLGLRVLPLNAGVAYVLNGPGGQRELASLVSVATALRDYQ